MEVRATLDDMGLKVASALAISAVLLAGCGGEPAAAPPPRTASPSASAPASSDAPSPSPSETLPPVTDKVSLPQLMREEFPGGEVTVLRESGSTDAYRRFEVSYPSGPLTITGVLLRPRGEGRFPGVVLAHGHIDTDIYVTGQGLRREQDRLAREGYVVLHTDYRGHAGSSPIPEGTEEDESRLGYTRDTINAVQAMKRLPYVDPDRTALLGRSMGGAVVMNALVAQPGLVRAGVTYASVSSDIVDNIKRWAVPSRPEEVARLYRQYGDPEREPEFWAGLSARTYFDRIEVPVQMHHGTDDESCPIRWAYTTRDLMESAGVRQRLWVYEGEQHAFGPQWDLSMRRVIGFLDRHLG
ncbi:PE-PGRS family protein [Nocardioidaceae bacterium Broad-1]|nr:PE-PGRS family protein [Nocardioidaceae bacterium Broad-1]